MNVKIPEDAVAAELSEFADQYRSIAGALDCFNGYWTGKAEAYSRVADDLAERAAQLRVGK